MNYSEKVLLRIQEIAQEQETDIVEAASIFCEENDIDVEDFIKMVDKNFVEQLKYVAIENRKVRRAVAKPASQLPI
jgi:hypothetical protein